MKKILVVDFNGTSSVYTHYLVNGIKSEGVEVKILGKKKPEFLDVFTETNQYLGSKIGVKLIDYVLNWFWLLTNYKKFDIIIIQWLQLLKYSSIEIHMISFLQSRILLLYIVHNLYPHNSKNIKVNNRYDTLYKACKNVAVQTKNIMQSIYKISPKANIINIEHGLFFKDFRIDELDTSTTKCLMIGYISKYKGIEDAIEIVKKLKAQEIWISLEIIGYGNADYINQLHKKIDEYGIADRITILPKEVSTKFLIRKVNDSGMLWLPYKNISQSGVAYTAMGLGIPIIAYDVGNFREAFGGKNIAEIVTKGNLEKFCFAVKKVIKNNSYYKNNIRKVFTDDIWKKNRVIINELLQ